MVSILWSLTNGGSAISSTVDAGSKANGETTTAKELFIRHDGGDPITNVGVYVRAFTGTYDGAASASTDLAELLSWGDDATEAGFGGLLINMDAINSYTASMWPTYSSKSPTYGRVVRTGVGDSEGNAIQLSKNTYSSGGTDGQIPAGSSVRFAFKIQVPDDEDTLGKRIFDMVLTYSYTS